MNLDGLLKEALYKGMSEWYIDSAIYGITYYSPEEHAVKYELTKYTKGKNIDMVNDTLLDMDTPLSMFLIVDGQELYRGVYDVNAFLGDTSSLEVKNQMLSFAFPTFILSGLINMLHNADNKRNV